MENFSIVDKSKIFINNATSKHYFKSFPQQIEKKFSSRKMKKSLKKMYFHFDIGLNIVRSTVLKNEDFGI